MNNLKLRQKRVWTEYGVLYEEFTILWIGKEIAVVQYKDGAEQSYTIENLQEKSIEKNKVKKGLKIGEFA